jgi:hypothetical protein
LVPAGVVGEVVKVGPTGALVRVSGYPPINVGLQDLEHATFFDLFPERGRRLGGWLRRRVAAGIGIATAAAIGAAVGTVITLEVRRLLGNG